jgi:hypothetical protein
LSLGALSRQSINIFLFPICSLRAAIHEGVVKRLRSGICARYSRN